MSYLAECIRKGIEKVPCQAFGAWFQGSYHPFVTQPKSACVLGTALIGVEIVPEPRICYSLLLRKVFPEIFATRHSKCPECGVVFYNCLANLIVHLNDEHHLTRVAIADWLESLEPRN